VLERSASLTAVPARPVHFSMDRAFFVF